MENEWPSQCRHGVDIKDTCDQCGSMDLARMTIKDLQSRCFENAQKCGWNDQPIPIPEMIALIHSEASEALEEFRKSNPQSWTNVNGKPLGLASEFADIIIRVCHYAELLGIDLEYELDRKLTYNLTRGYRHGGKVI